MKLLNSGFSGLMILLSVGCQPDSKQKNETTNREPILTAAREIIQASGKCALITLDEKGLPQVRTMDPFEPESDFTIWLATNPKSRKVGQLRNNPNVTLYYADKNDNGYVSIYGSAELVNDQQEKNKRWKAEWKDFYPNQTDGYLLIKVIPTRLEVINYSRGINGNPDTWQPTQVYFNE
jgi:general stress protein 26